MKYFIAVFILLNCWFVTGQVDTNLIVYEPFDYANFNPIEGDDRSGFGWLGPWMREKGDDVIIHEGNLEFQGLDLLAGNHCSVAYVRQGIRFNRSIAPVNDDGQVVWLSVIMEFPPGSNRNNVGNITLTRNGSQVFTFGRKFGNELFGCIWPPNVSQYNTDIPTLGRHWLVVKIQFSGDSGGEQAWLWVDPMPETKPDEAEADLVMPQSGLPGLAINGGFNGVQLKAEGTAPLFVDYDELKIGRTFSAISSSVKTAVKVTPATPTHFKLYPNPSTHRLVLEWELRKRQELAIQILQPDGRLVFQIDPRLYTVGVHQEVIDLHKLQLNPGLYILHVDGKELRLDRKFVYHPR